MFEVGGVWVCETEKSATPGREAAASELEPGRPKYCGPSAQDYQVTKRSVQGRYRIIRLVPRLRPSGILTSLLRRLLCFFYNGTYQDEDKDLTFSKIKPLDLSPPANARGDEHLEHQEVELIRSLHNLHITAQSCKSEVLVKALNSVKVFRAAFMWNHHATMFNSSMARCAKIRRLHFHHHQLVNIARTETPTLAHCILVEPTQPFHRSVYRSGASEDSTEASTYHAAGSVVVPNSEYIATTCAQARREIQPLCFCHLHSSSQASPGPATGVYEKSSEEKQRQTFSRQPRRAASTCRFVDQAWVFTR
ncbi:hypothetical protein M436DRAFT_62577 [Aureobasidium namibiae CBS 147.97]|uniref:Uncharacterized protein n=1 Tax=Aureobasidium namibiae CBS 147.97 TaxID=1043004 RepID=A0A074WPX4_9PEZI